MNFYFITGHENNNKKIIKTLKLIKYIVIRVKTFFISY